MKRFQRLEVALYILMALWTAIPSGAWAQAAPDTAVPAAQVLPRIPGILEDKTPIRITTFIDKAVIRVGDLINYSMTVEVPAGSQIMMPPPGAQLGMFLIRDYQFPGLEEKEPTWSDRAKAWIERTSGVKLAGSTKGAMQEFNFTITAYNTGDLIIPAVPVMVIDARGARHALFAESARIRVVPITNPEDLTIKDIKPPVGLPLPIVPYLPYALIPVLAIGALAALAWFMLRRKKQELELIPLRPAHEIAREELLVLDNLDLLAAGEYEKFYTQISWIIRKYLSLRFSMYALEYTTSEILERLKAKAVEHGDYEKIRRFLEEADQVKFARHEPSLEQRNSVLARAREIVENTKEEPLEVEVREAA